MIVPEHLVRHVLDAGIDEACLVANRLLNSHDDRPALVMLANDVATAVLLEMLMTAIEHAPDEATKQGWRGFALNLTSAIQGALTT